MGCTAWSWFGSQRVNESPTYTIILNGLRFFSDNFSKGQVVWK